MSESSESKQRVIYVCGPMTGYVDYNYPAFALAAEALRHHMPDARVINPAENFHGQKGLAYKTYIRKSFEQVLESTDLYVLPGWIASRGATAEVKMAELLDLEIFFVPPDMASYNPNDIVLQVMDGGVKAGALPPMNPADPDGEGAV